MRFPVRHGGTEGERRSGWRQRKVWRWQPGVEHSLMSLFSRLWEDGTQLEMITGSSRTLGHEPLFWGLFPLFLFFVLFYTCFDSPVIFEPSLYGA